jgi:putative membrane protein
MSEERGRTVQGGADLAGKDLDQVSAQLSTHRTGLSFQRTRMSADRTGLALVVLGVGLLTMGIWYHVRFMLQLRAERRELLKQGLLPGDD